MTDAPAPSDPATVGQIAAALRHDPILVSPMMGGGDTTEVVHTLTGLHAHAVVPV